MKEKEIQDELASIRNLMERSSKFISLSGLSGILAGVYALIGAALAYRFLYYGMPAEINPYRNITGELDYYVRGVNPVVTGVFYGGDFLLPLLAIAVLVLLSSIVTGYILSSRKAKRNGQKIWSKTSRALLFHMATPLVSGGIFILIFLYHHHYGVVAPTSLIFYGLALVGASNFTFTLVKYLGICEIIIGLIAACLPGYGLLFWAIGFGVLHIVYGSMMYFKYDR